MWFCKCSYLVNIINPYIYTLWSLQRQKLVSFFDNFDHVRSLLTFFAPFAYFNLVKYRYTCTFPSSIPSLFLFLSLSFYLPPSLLPFSLSPSLSFLMSLKDIKHMHTYTQTHTHTILVNILSVSFKYVKKAYRSWGHTHQILRLKMPPGDWTVKIAIFPSK